MTRGGLVRCASVDAHSDPARDGSNVVVAVRVRPFSESERRDASTGAVRVGNDGVSVIVSEGGGGEKVFSFDHCFDSTGDQGIKGAPEASQSRVYDGIGKAVTEHALDGFNTCIFAYGQTGAGKTYTMMGALDGTARGVIPRLCENLFHRMDELAHTREGFSFKAEASYFEIHNEQVRCLLSHAGGTHRVREHPVTGPYVEGLLRAEVEDSSQVHALLERGNSARTVAATHSNSHSSRSHSVFTVTLTQFEVDMATAGCSELVSRINLVDLAGSERLSPAQADADRMKEGININKSLSTLGRVINALA
eukprot:Hpha_TRINITY_DN15565_c7_g1::TRINITY_DN15565_c7_g1_i1::g.108059::m.108059/K10392/KIF1; kinesin family member 1